MRRVPAETVFDGEGQMLGYLTVDRISRKFIPEDRVRIVDYKENPDELINAVEWAATATDNKKVLVLECGDDQYYITWDR